jgi:hypothetical protein
MTELSENTMKQVTTDKLLEDLKVVVSDAEELLKATAGQAGEKVAAARARPGLGGCGEGAHRGGRYEDWRSLARGGQGHW